MYTDGVPEAVDREMSFFGDQRMLDCLSENSGKDSLDHMVKSMLDGIDRFAGGAPQADDITMLALRYSGGSPISS